MSFRALKQANDVRNQLYQMATKQGLSLNSMPQQSPEYYDNIKKCLLSGFFMQVGHLERAGHYLTLKDEQVVMIHPSTSLDSKPQWVMYNEFVLTNKNYIRTVTEIRPEWLFEASAEYFDLEEFKKTSESTKKLERLFEKHKAK